MAKNSKKKRVFLIPPKREKEKYIKERPLVTEGLLSFNLKYLEEKGDKFKYTEKDKQYFLKLVERLKIICCINRREFVNARSNALRTHRITWNDVTENTFGLGDEQDSDAWQFEISSNEHGRVHGFFIEETFYVRWLDPNHELYS